MSRCMTILLLVSLTVGVVGCQTQQAKPTRASSRSVGAGDTIEWSDAVKLIRSMQVKTVVHYHSRDVILTMHDGKQLRTVEPEIGNIGRIVRELDPSGKRISYWTE